MPEEVLLLIVGFIAGIASGLFGIGGGVIMVPALITFFSFAQLTANGTSLAARLVPVGIFAALTYYRAGKLQFKTAFTIAIGIAIGGFFGSKIAIALPPERLKQFYGFFLLYVAWRFINPLQYLRRNNPSDAAEQDEPSPLMDWYFMLALGIIAGVAGGLFGIGGGVVIGPALVTVFRFPHMLAIGTSLGALQFPAGATAAVNYYADGNLEIESAVFMGLGIIFGAYLGARVAFSLPKNTIKLLYAIFLVVIAVRFIVQV